AACPRSTSSWSISASSCSTRRGSRNSTIETRWGLPMLVTKDSSESFARRESGGKGFNLYLLSREGFPVPPWAVVGASYFRKFREQAGLDAAIANILGKTESDGQF